MTSAPTSTAPSPRPTAPEGDRGALNTATRGLTAVVVAISVMAGVGLRFATISDLWLDEALSVNIARLPINAMIEALRHDGAPPLYYLLLHGWISVFGDGDLAVRSLSAVASLPAIPLAWVAARRHGRAVATAATVLVATSPFAVRYATEARMYSLVITLVLAGYVAMRALLEKASVAAFAGVGLASGLLYLTHYWSFYLAAAVGVALLLAFVTTRDRAYVFGIMAITGGGALFAPWVPVFLDQLAHTGTPWGRPAGPFDAVVTTITDFGGGRGPEGRALGIFLAVLAGLALTGTAVDRFRVEIDLRTRAGVRAETMIAAATLLIAIAAGLVTASAFATRYAAVFFPLAIVVAACGVRVFSDERIRAGVLVVAALLGVAGGVRNALTQRTQAAEIATYINERARAGSVVAYCPDQLAPDVDRLITADVNGVTFPDASSPKFVDWTDYASRNRAGDPRAFVNQVLAEAGDGDVFLVWMPGYRRLGEKCEQVSIALGVARPATRLVIKHDRQLFERHNLSHAPAP